MSTPNPYHRRFALSQRVEHAVMVASFITLAVTGLPQKFAAAAWADAMIKFYGGIDNTRIIHHCAATVLMLVAVYHFTAVAYRVVVRRVPMLMLPTLQDARDALQTFLYNVGLAKRRPQMGRYTFEEKVEYWSLMWGTVVMIVTGFMMWNPIATARFLPGQFIPAAKAAHGGEALLAVIAIIIWHMWSVHLRHFNKSMWTGSLTEEEMLHEHPLELADLKAGVAERNSLAGHQRSGTHPGLCGRRRRDRRKLCHDQGRRRRPHPRKNRGGGGGSVHLHLRCQQTGGRPGPLPPAGGDHPHGPPPRLRRTREPGWGTPPAGRFHNG